MTTSSPDCIYIDAAALNHFLATAGAARDPILQTAWRLLLEANVFRDSNGQDLPPTTLTMNMGRLLIEVDGALKVWDGPDLLPTDGLIQVLAYALAAILNSPPTEGGIDWPWSKN